MLAIHSPRRRECLVNERLMAFLSNVCGTRVFVRDVLHVKESSDAVRVEIPPRLTQKREMDFVTLAPRQWVVN